MFPSLNRSTPIDPAAMGLAAREVDWAEAQVVAKYPPNQVLAANAREESDWELAIQPKA